MADSCYQFNCLDLYISIKQGVYYSLSGQMIFLLAFLFKHCDQDRDQGNAGNYRGRNDIFFH